MINLIIKGSYDDAILAAKRYDVLIGNLRRHEWNYTLATCDDKHLPGVIKWYAHDLSLLLYSQKDQ